MSKVIGSAPHGVGSCTHPNHPPPRCFSFCVDFCLGLGLDLDFDFGLGLGLGLGFDFDFDFEDGFDLDFGLDFDGAGTDFGADFVLDAVAGVVLACTATMARPCTDFFLDPESLA